MRINDTMWVDGKDCFMKMIYLSDRAAFEQRPPYERSEPDGCLGKSVPGNGVLRTNVLRKKQMWCV